MVVLIDLPGSERPHTGSPEQIEHIVAYFGTAEIFFGLKGTSKNADFRRIMRI
jgi:hypothetical protein